MPTIKEYSQRVETPGAINLPRATAGPSSGMYEMGTLLQNTGEVIQKRAEQSELSELSAAMARKQAEYSNKLTEDLRVSDPTDKDFSRNFVQEFDDDMADLRNNASTSAGRRFFEQNYNEMRTQFSMKSFRGQADKAGEHAKNLYISTEDNLSSDLSKNPDNWEINNKLHDNALNSLIESYGLDNVTAEKMRIQGKEKLAKANISGWANIDPAYARKKLDSGEYDKYLGADGIVAMRGHINQAEAAARAEAERQRLEQKRILEEKQANTQNDFLGRMNEGKLTDKMILNSNLEPFGSGSKQQFIAMLDAHNKAGGKFKTDPSVFNELFRKIHLPDSDPNKIVNDTDLNQYVIAGKLDFEDLGKLRKEIQGKGTAEGGILAESRKQTMEMARSSLVKVNALGARDPQGEARLKQFQDYTYQREEEMRKAGKPISDLYRSSSPDYLGKDISRFQRSTQEIFKDMYSMNGPVSTTPIGTGTANVAVDPNTKQVTKVAPVQSANPRLPNESAADYLKRIGK